MDGSFFRVCSMHLAAMAVTCANQAAQGSALVLEHAWCTEQAVVSA